jgi:hypothetical protein
MTRTLIALIATQMLALGALAQSNIEYGRASSGLIESITKQPRRLSGSLGLTHSTGLFGGRGYEATLGGELLDERLWFFAAGTVLARTQYTADLPAGVSAVQAQATAQPVDWTAVTASFHQLQQPAFGTTTFNPTDATLPSSFLSLRSTTMLSDQAMLNFSFTRSTGTRSAFGLPAEAQ